MDLPSSILLNNATILAPKAKNDDSCLALRGYSLLIEGSKIVNIAIYIEPPSSTTEVIDCTGKIVSPGFIDTHHHVWQTQLKGRHANHSLMEYIPTGSLQCYNYTSEDIFWGQLGGCLEAINAGITTVVDHANMNYAPNHNTSAIAATVSSGIRSIFCYVPTTRVKEWEPSLTVDENLLPDWTVKQAEELTKDSPYGNGLVQLGLGFDAVFLPTEIVTDLFDRCRRAGTKLITSHYVRGAVFGQHSIVDLIDGHGLLGSDILISHASNLTESDAKKLKEAGASISSTPDTEVQMGLGMPVCFQDNIKDICSLGIDCHSNNGCSLVGQMRLGLQAERGRRNEELVQAGKAPLHLNTTVQDVFKLGTIGGARAISMENQVGSLEVGKEADIVIFDGLSPGMVCAADQDPIAAIVLHSSIADIDMVIIGGKIVKRRGKLTSVNLDLSLTDFNFAKTNLEWPEVADLLLQSRQKVNEAERQSWSGNLEVALNSLKKAFYIKEGSLI